MNGRSKNPTRRVVGLGPAEIAAIGAIAEERVVDAKNAGPPASAISDFNARHRAIPIAREDFTGGDPAKAGRVALFHAEFRESEIARVRAAWTAEPLRREALADGRLTPEDIAAIGVEVRHKVGAGDRALSGGQGRDGRGTPPPAAARPQPAEPPKDLAPAAFAKAPGLTVGQQEAADRLARRMYYFEGWAKRSGVDGFAIGERELSDANRRIATDPRYPGLRPIAAADLAVAPSDGGTNFARLLVYRTLAEQAVRDEAAGVRADKGRPFLGAWADAPLDPRFKDPREKGFGAKVGGFFKGVGRAATYEERPETIEARGAEARLVARLGPASRENRAWADRAEGKGAILEPSRLRGMSEALAGHVYRDRTGRPIEAHHVPFLEATALRIAQNPKACPPSSADIERFTREGNSGRTLTARDLAAMSPESRMPFARWYASELWEQAVDAYAEANRGIAKGKYPERTAAATADVLERVIEETSRRNGPEFSRLVAEARLVETRDAAYLDEATRFPSPPVHAPTTTAGRTRPVVPSELGL